MAHLIRIDQNHIVNTDSITRILDLGNDQFRIYFIGAGEEVLTTEISKRVQVQMGIPGPAAASAK